MRRWLLFPVYGIQGIKTVGWIVLVTIFMIVPSEPLYGEFQPQSRFNRANYLMEEQDYEGALSVFHEIEEQGYVSGPLFHNMGISYVYLDSLGQATYYFRVSTRFRETRKQAREGLSFIERSMRNNGTFIPYLTWYAFTDWFLFGMNHFRWIVWGIVLLNSGVLILLAGWFYRPHRWITIGGSATAIAGLLLLFASIAFFIRARGYQQAVVIEPQVRLHPEPHEMIDEETASDLAYEAYTVTLDREMSRDNPGWTHIRLRNGIAGWVPESSIRVL